MNLAHLTEPETRELIALRLNGQPEELADDLVGRVHALCGGNPFFIAETVREWYEKQAITRGEGGWVLRTEAADSTDVPETVRDVMRLRLQGLPPMVQQVLGAGSVIGALVEIDLLSEALPDLSESDVLDAIDVLIPRRVFRETGNAGRVEFVHDLLREMAYAELSASRRRSLHRRVGEVLEQRRMKGRAVAAAVLAEHFRHAEDLSRGFAYTVEAAEAALEAYAFKDAIARLNEAENLLPSDADATTRYKLSTMLGQASGCLGRLDEAIAAHSQALTHSEKGITRGRAHLGIAENYLRKGHFEDALRHFDLAGHEVGYPRPTTLARLLFDTGKSALYVHCLPRWVGAVGRGPDRLRDRDGIRVQLPVFPDPRDGQYPQVRELRVQGRAVRQADGDSRTGGRRFVDDGDEHGLPRPVPVPRAPHRGRLEGGRDASSRYALGQRDRDGGAAQYAAGCLDESEALFRQAVEPLDRVAQYLTSFSHHFLRHLYAVRGDIPSELAEAEAEIALGTIRGDGEALAWGKFGKASALARAGRTDEALELTRCAVEILLRRKSMAVVIAQGIEGFAHMQASDYAAARSVLEESARRIRADFWYMEVANPTFPLLVESLLGPRWSDPRGGPGRRVARKAWRKTRFARFLGWLFPNLRRTPCASAAARRSPSASASRPRGTWSERSPRPRSSAPATTSPAPCSTLRS